MPTEDLPTSPYTIVIDGDELIPELPKGAVAVFDPNPETSPLDIGKIVAVWLHGYRQPHVTRLHIHTESPSAPAEHESNIAGFEQMIVIGTASVPLRRVKAMHALLRVADGSDDSIVA